MIYDVIVAPRVLDELDASLAYINDTLCSPNAASRLLYAFEEAVESLKTNPLAYPIQQQLSYLAGHEIRSTRLGNYRLCFRVNKELQRVDVVFFKHVRQDTERYLNSHN